MSRPRTSVRGYHRTRAGSRGARVEPGAVRALSGSPRGRVAFPTRTCGRELGVDVLVMRAEREPRPGVAHPGPHELYRWPRLSVEPRALGASVAPGHLRVEMHLVGICGTDLHAVQCDPDSGYIRGSAPLEIGADGRVLGHEGVGRVLAVGAGVADIRPGDWVAFESLETCHRCAACRSGSFNQCANAVLIGMQRDGVFAEVVELPAQLAHGVNDLAASEAGRRAAACLEPAACSYVALSLARVQPGEDVVI